MLIIQVVPSCSPTVHVTSDYDRNAGFAKYKTFGLYDIKSKNGQVSDLNVERITNAIRGEMMAKGFSESNNSPDLMVNAITMLKDKQSVTANTNYYGYGGIYRPYGYWGGGMLSGTTTYNTYNYKDGSLMIDIVDTKSGKMVWQGTGNADIDKAPDKPDEFIQGAVKKILGTFPPGSAK